MALTPAAARAVSSAARQDGVPAVRVRGDREVPASEVTSGCVLEIDRRHGACPGSGGRGHRRPPGGRDRMCRGR